MAEEAVPYQDFAATGSIGLCDRNGQQITSGRITDKPFAWRAVSSVKAPDGYTGEGRRASLLIYQPRPKTYPPQWNGDTLTSSSTYSNPDVPMAAATDRDASLADFIAAFPPKWDGYLQLRMYFGIAGKPVPTDAYPAADIKVTGDTWTMVRGATVSCTAGTAKDTEQKPLATAKPKPTKSGAAGNGTGSPSGSASPGGSSGAAVPGSGGGGTGGVTDGTDEQVLASSVVPSGSGGKWYALGGIAVVLLLVGLGAWWFRRSQRPTGPAT